MFINTTITPEIATKYNSDAADVIVYIPVKADGSINVDNYASLCIWIVPNTQIDC